MKTSILLLNKSYFKAELESLGHRVFCAVPRQELSSTRPDAWSLEGYDFVFESGLSLPNLLDSIPFVPEKIIYYDDSQPVFRIKNFHESPVPVAFYAIDSHIHYRWHPRQCGVFDAVLVAQKDLLPAFAEFCGNCRWFPLWAPLENSPTPNPTIPVSFRGNLDPVQRKKRIEFLVALAERVPLDFGSGAYPEIYRNSKIVVNESVQADLNFRVFEALMSGALLLTTRIANGLSELFVLGKHYIDYAEGNVEEAASKISYYLAHENERSVIARAGREEVLTRHTSLARAKTLSEILSSLPRSQRPLQFYSLAYQELFDACENSKKGISPSPDCIERANEWLVRSLTRREKCDFVLVQAVMAVKDALIAIGGPSPALVLCETACNAFPSEPSLRLLYIETLVQRGEHIEGLSQSRHINPDSPEVILDSVTTVLATLRSNSLFQIIPGQQNIE